MTRKKKSKKSWKDTAEPEEADSAALAEKIRRRIASGKSPTALKMAKTFARRHPGALADKVLVQALQTRVPALFVRVKAREARDLLEHAGATFPGRE